MWQQVENIIKEYEKTNLQSAINYEEFSRIAIVHHSSGIEGSTLTLVETQLLLQEGITAKGKPMEHHLMVQDHYEALKFVLDSAKKKVPVTRNFIQQINALVMKRTGGIVKAAEGTFDTSKGDLRLVSVTAGDTFFVNYLKVPKMVDDLCNEIEKKIKTIQPTPTLPTCPVPEVGKVGKITRQITRQSARADANSSPLGRSGGAKDVLQLSFDAHYYLVSIHPFADGNGRTSRLLMNYIQAYHNKPLSIVYIEDKKDYIEALKKSRDDENIHVFREFMCNQYVKYLSEQIGKFKKQDKNILFLF